jgi:hypothetical protein
MEKRVCGCGLRPKTKEERNLELRKDAARIVEGVENYSAADRDRRAAEVEAAFPPVAGKAAAAKKPAVAAKKPAAAKTAAAKKPAVAKKAPAAGKTIAKSVPPGPTLAGLSTGSHLGEVC